MAGACRKVYHPHCQSPGYTCQVRQVPVEAEDLVRRRQILVSCDGSGRTESEILPFSMRAELLPPNFYAFGAMRLRMRGIPICQ